MVLVNNVWFFYLHVTLIIVEQSSLGVEIALKASCCIPLIYLHLVEAYCCIPLRYLCLVKTSHCIPLTYLHFVSLQWVCGMHVNFQV